MVPGPDFPGACLQVCVCAVNILIPSVFLTFFLSLSYQQITGADWGIRHFYLKSGRWTVGISVPDQGDGQLPFLSILCHSSDYDGFLFLCFSPVLWLFIFTRGALHCDESPVRFPLSLGWPTLWTGFSPCMPPHRSYTSDLPPQELKKTPATGSCSGIYWNGFAQNCKRYKWKSHWKNVDVFFPLERSRWANRGCQLYKGVSDVRGLCTFPTSSWVRELRSWKTFMGPHRKRWFWHVCQENDCFPIWPDISEGSFFLTKCKDWEERRVHDSTKSTVDSDQWEATAEAGFGLFSPLPRDQHMVSWLR